MGDGVPGVRPNGGVGAHCHAGWAGEAGGGGLGGRNDGTMTTKGCPVSAVAERGHDNIVGATSTQTRTQRLENIHLICGLRDRLEPPPCPIPTQPAPARRVWSGRLHQMAMATLSTQHAILADTGCDPKAA